MKRGMILAAIFLFLTAGLAEAQEKIRKPTTQEMYNLQVKGHDIAITDIAVDDGCFLKVTFENKGKSEIHTTLPVKVWLDGILAHDHGMLFDHLAPGASRTHIFCGFTSPIMINGTRTAKVTVGTVLAWRENLRNNTLEKSVTCRPNYDIAVTDIGVDENCVLWVKFVNRGATRIHTRLHFKLWIDRMLVKDEDMLFDDFRSGVWRKHHYTGGTPLRILKPSMVRAFVDTTNKLSETDEANNKFKKQVECKKKLR